MSMLLRLDDTGPVAARSEMNWFVRLSTLLERFYNCCIPLQKISPSSRGSRRARAPGSEGTCGIFWDTSTLVLL